MNAAYKEKNLSDAEIEKIDNIAELSNSELLEEILDIIDELFLEVLKVELKRRDFYEALILVIEDELYERGLIV